MPYKDYIMMKHRRQQIYQKISTEFKKITENENMKNLGKKPITRGYYILLWLRQYCWLYNNFKAVILLLIRKYKLLKYVKCLRQLSENKRGN